MILLKVMDRDEKLRRFLQLWEKFEEEMDKDPEDDLRIGGCIGSEGGFPSEPSDK